MIMQLLSKKSLDVKTSFKYSRYRNTNDEEWRKDLDSRVMKKEAKTQQAELEFA